MMNGLCHRFSARKPAFAVLLAAWLVAAPAARTETDIRRDAVVQAVEKVMPSVVNIATETLVEARNPIEELFYGSRTHKSLGSGVIISDDGYLLTNMHVVKSATRIQVKLSDAAGGGVYDVQPVYVVTPNQDVALLKITPKPGQKFKAVHFARNDDLLLGETVVALGNPFGLGESVSRGILSSKSRVPAKEGQDLGMENWLQTDALINPGNSGGPLIDLHGDLIGINVAILQGAQGIGFAIPIKEVRQALEQMFNPETASRWFGARVAVNWPLKVESVEDGSPAKTAGMKTGDIILRLDGQAPRDFMDFNGTSARNVPYQFRLDHRPWWRPARRDRSCAAVCGIISQAIGRRVARFDAGSRRPNGAGAVGRNGNGPVRLEGRERQPGGRG